MLQLTEARRNGFGWIVLGVAAIFLAVAVVGRFGSTAGILLLVVVALAPLLVLVDGAPVWFLMAVLPSASLFNGSSAGVGGLKAATLIVLPCWTIGVLMRRQTVRVHLEALDFAVIALFLVALINIVLFSLSAVGPANLIQQYGGDLILYLLVRCSITSERSLKVALTAFLVGSIPALIVALWRFGHGQTLVSENLARLQLPGANTNVFASTVLVTAGVALGFALYEHVPRLRVLWWSLFAVSSLAVILSFSRGAFVGAFAMIVTGVVISRDSRVRLASIGIVVFGLIASRPEVAGQLGLSTYVSRISSILSGSSSPFRRILWAMGWKAFRSHPLFGLGVGNFQLPQFWYPLASHEIVTAGFLAAPLAVHNFYLGWAVDTGILGAIFLAVAMVTALQWSVRVAWNQNAPEELHAMALAVTLAFVGFFASITFSPSQKDQLPYILLAVVASLWSLGSRRKSDPALQPTPVMGRGGV
jgi:O-antigen ligase